MHSPPRYGADISRKLSPLKCLIPRADEMEQTYLFTACRPILYRAMFPRSVKKGIMRSARYFYHRRSHGDLVDPSTVPSFLLWAAVSEKLLV